MQEYNDFETQTREELLEDTNTGLVLLFSDEIEFTCFVVESEENVSYNDGAGVTLIKSKEQLRKHLDDGCVFHDMSKGTYQQYILTKLNTAPDHIKDAYLENNTITLYNAIKTITKLKHNFIKKLLETKSIWFYNDVNDLAISLQFHNFGAELLNIFLEKHNEYIKNTIQRDIIFNNFPKQLSVFTSELVVCYLRDKNKSIFIDESNLRTITINIDLNVVMNKNNEMRVSLSSLCDYLLILTEQVKSFFGIEEINLVSKVKDNQISSVKMYFNLSKACVFNKEELEEFLESYFDFITTLQGMEKDEILTDIHAWIPSQLRAMQLELTLKDKKSIKIKSKI